MKAGTRLALYGAGLAVAFGAAFGISGVVVPDSVVNRVVSENCGSASGACRLEITSRLPDSMDAFIAFGSEK